MIRKRLAALILTAGLCFSSGCTAGYSFGNPNGGSGFGSGGHPWHSGRNGPTTAAALPAPCCPPCYGGNCCEIPGACGDGCCPGGGCGVVAGPGYAIMPPASMPIMPPAGVPTYPPPQMPQLTEPPLGSNTKFSPVPQSIPFPYTPTGY